MKNARKLGLILIILLLITSCTTNGKSSTDSNTHSASVETSFFEGSIKSTVIESEEGWLYEVEENNISEEYQITLDYVVYHGDHLYSFLYRASSNKGLLKRVIHNVYIAGNDSNIKYSYVDLIPPFDSLESINNSIEECELDISDNLYKLSSYEENEETKELLSSTQSLIKHLEEYKSTLNTKKEIIVEWIEYLNNILESEQNLDMQTYEQYVEIIMTLEK